jgi:3-deoxy-7-phosphoheptulonate synthase
MTSNAAFPMTGYQLFPSPVALLAELPLPAEAAAMVARSRADARAVLDGTDDRLLVITGPCSVHDSGAALDYAARLAETGLADDLLIVMRVYAEKPRTVTGWTGLVNDPGMDGSHDVRGGLPGPGGCSWASPRSGCRPAVNGSARWSRTILRTW